MFEDGFLTKTYIYYVYIVIRLKNTKYGLYPMVILWVFYGYPVVKHHL